MLPALSPSRRNSANLFMQADIINSSQCSVPNHLKATGKINPANTFQRGRDGVDLDEGIHVHAHHQCGGGVANVDLDEGVHAIYVLLNYLIKVLNGSSSDAFAQEILKEWAQFTAFPNEWLSSQAVHAGATDSIVGFSMAGPLAFLSILAMKAGYEETVEALERNHILTAQHRQILSRLNYLNNLVVASTTNLDKDLLRTSVELAKKLETHTLNQVSLAVKHNDSNVGIGVSSFVSGASIFSRVTGETVLQIVAASIANSPKLAWATTAFGIAGTLFLGPVAAAAAFCLGVFFVYQSRTVYLQYASDRRLIEGITARRLITAGTSADCNVKLIGEASVNNAESANNVNEFDECDELEKAYQAFIDRKLTSREKFSAKFFRWNCGFLSGAGIYAASAVTKMVFGIVSIMAAGLVLSPAGFVVLLILGIVGGVGMTVCSWQFLMYHGKSKKHESYKLQESRFLGRRFDLLQTSFAASLNGRKANFSASGVRAALYNFVTQRDLHRQKFLDNVAVNMGKFRKWEQRATYSDSTLGKTTKVKESLKNVLAGLSFVGVYLKNLFSGAGHKVALFNAQDSFASLADNLTVFGLTKLFDEGDRSVDNDLRELIRSSLQKQNNFITEKCNAYAQVSEDFTNLDGSIPNEVTESFEVAKTEYEADTVRLEKMTQLLAEMDLSDMNYLKKQFMEIEGLDVTGLTTFHDINKQFAHYLMKDLTDELTTTRGILFDMHRQSFHLQATLNPIDQDQNLNPGGWVRFKNNCGQFFKNKFTNTTTA